MLKYTLMASAMMIAAPVIAQEQPMSTPSKSTSLPTAPVSQTSAPSQTPAQAPTADPMTAGDPATTTSSTGQTSATGSADASASGAGASGAVSGSAQIAQVVESEFPTYDKNADGKLSTSEFGSWMVALRSASDPSAKAGSKEMKAWTTTAFAQADTDKSKSISKAELEGFLAKGQS